MKSGGLRANRKSKNLGGLAPLVLPPMSSMIVMIMNNVNIVCSDYLCTLVQGMACLHCAAQEGRTDIVKYLLDNTRLCEQVDILNSVS